MTTPTPGRTHQFLCQDRLGLPERQPERISWDDEEVPPGGHCLKIPRCAVVMSLPAIPIPSIARNFATSDASVELGSDGDTETQKERIDDRVTHSHTSGSDIPASQFQRSGQNDITREDEHDGRGCDGCVAEISR